ncbi:MAG: hypothetical protein Q4G62_01195 [Pseudomonadota bacterium]|nr:hypothetical protein [Pseudomonadota bacterium]
MRKIAALLFLIAVSNPTTAAVVCPVAEKDLLGYWSKSSQAGNFEEFLLEVDAGTRTFNSWLHQRPDLMQATWKIEHCRLVITSRSGEHPEIRLKIVGLGEGKLRLYDELAREGSIYRRSGDAP